MNSRVVGIIKFESSPLNGRGTDHGVDYSEREEGLTLERWLSVLVGGECVADAGSSPRWENRSGITPSPRRVRANLEQLAEELNREYLELAAT